VQLFTKEGIIQQLNSAVDAFEQTARQLSSEQFFSQPEGAWSAADQLEHLILAVKPLHKAFNLPKLVLRVLFGKPNRNASMNYMELIKKYQGKLERGAKASAAFTPQTTMVNDDKDAIINNFAQNYNIFTDKIAKINEYDLDNYQLPHPILGKLSLREMLYFTAYHVEHHHTIVKKRTGEKLGAKNKK
jgi:DinB superfamily